MNETKGYTMEDFVERATAAFRKWQSDEGDLFRASWTTKPYEMPSDSVGPETAGIEAG